MKELWSFANCNLQNVISWFRLEGFQEQGHGQQVRAAPGGEIALNELPVQLCDFLRGGHSGVRDFPAGPGFPV